MENGGRDDIFPVPPLNSYRKNEGRFSRGTAQRLGRHLARQKRINDCIGALNWMAGCSWKGQSADRTQLEVQSYVAQCVDERTVPKPLPSPEEAASVLLRTTAGYEPDPGRCGPAALDSDFLSLPSCINGAPYADELG